MFIKPDLKLLEPETQRLSLALPRKDSFSFELSHFILPHLSETLKCWSKIYRFVPKSFDKTRRPFDRSRSQVTYKGNDTSSLFHVADIDDIK
jgi:hypothetical protein